jgi:hypothetical protein
MARFSERTRRAALGACTGIFVVTLLGGAAGGLAGGVGSSIGNNPKRGSAGHSHGASETSVSTTTAARHALLALSDLPTGWAQGAGRATTSHGAAWSAPLARCVGVPAVIADAQPTRMTSPNFTSSDKTLAVEDSVSVYKTAAEARAQFAALDNPRTPACMNSVAAEALRATVQSEAGDNATVGTVSIAGLNPAQFPHDAGFSVSIPLVSGGRELTISSTEVDFVSGRLNQQLTFNGNGAGFPVLLALQLIKSAHATPAPSGP